MPLDKATIRNLNMQCRRALKKPLKFVYCPEGADGDPVLIIDKVVKPQLTELRKTAKQKKFVQGSIKKNGKVLALYPRQAPGKLKRDLTNTFAKKVTLLKTATVVLPDEAAREREEAGRESPEMAELAAQIGRRGAKFRASPDGVARGKLSALLEQIEEYKNGGGRTNFSGLRKEIRQELKRRAALREQDSTDTDTTDTDTDVSPDVDTGTDTTSDETPSEDTSSVDLGAMQARIGQLAAKFRSNPQRPSDKQLRQLRDRIKEYVQAGGTTDFSLLRQELTDEWKRRRAESSEPSSTVIEGIRSLFSEARVRGDAILERLRLPDTDQDLDTMRDNLAQLKALRAEIAAHNLTLLSA